MSSESFSMNINDMTDQSTDVSSSCMRTTEFVQSEGPKTSTPVKSKQVLIVTGDEMPVSSDESATIDVTNYQSQTQYVDKIPWDNDMNVDDIQIEIVSDLNETEIDVKSVVLNGYDRAPPVYFYPLGDDD